MRFLRWLFPGPVAPFPSGYTIDFTGLPEPAVGPPKPGGPPPLTVEEPARWLGGKYAHAPTTVRIEGDAPYLIVDDPLMTSTWDDKVHSVEFTLSRTMALRLPEGTKVVVKRWPSREDQCQRNRWCVIPESTPHVGCGGFVPR